MRKVNYLPWVSVFLTGTLYANDTIYPAACTVFWKNYNSWCKNNNMVQLTTEPVLQISNL